MYENMKFRALIIFVSILISNQVAISQLYYPIISKDSKWGYIDEEGNVKIIPQFDAARLFHENLAAVLIGNKWGYIDTNGNILIGPEFENAYSFNEGLALVQVDSLYGYINTEGKFLIFPRYIDGYSFNENRALVKLDYHKWVVIDTTNTIIANEIDYYGNEDGVPTDYYFNSGVLVIPKSEYDSEIIQILNLKGKNRQIPNLYLSSNGYSDSLILFEKNGLFGYLDLKYKKVIKEKYNFATDFLDGYAWVINSDSGKYFIQMIDKSNNILFEYSLNGDSIRILSITNISNRMCLIPYSIHGNDKVLVLNNSGKIVSFSASELVLTFYEYKYPYFKRLLGNLILVKKNNQYKYIDMNGYTVWPN
jgi:hypothetical protein